MNGVSQSHRRLPWYKKVVRETKRIGHQVVGVVDKGLDVIELGAQKSGLKHIVQKTGIGAYASVGSPGAQVGINPGNYGPAIGIGVDATGNASGYINYVPITQISVEGLSMGDEVLAAVKHRGSSPLSSDHGISSEDLLAYDPSWFEATFVLVNKAEQSGVIDTGIGVVTSTIPEKSYLYPAPVFDGTSSDPHPLINLIVAAGQGIERARDKQIVAPIAHMISNPTDAATHFMIHKIELPIDAVNSARMYISEKLSEKGISNAYVDAAFLKGTDGTRERNQARKEGLDYIKTKFSAGTTEERVALISEITASLVFECLIGKVTHAGAEKASTVVFDRVDLLHGYDLVDAIVHSDV
jgi:hypothetical protein